MSPSRFLTVLLLVILALAALSGSAAAQGAQPAAPDAPFSAAFSYQGSLGSNGAPANGAFDFQFILYDAASGGGQVGTTVALEDVAVSNGSFTVALDFGAAAFDGQARWLQVGVRPGTSTGAYTILSPRHALTAVPDALYATKAPWSGLQSVPTGFADGTDDVGWALTGNAGATPGTNFLGTTDNQALELKVNGQRALRLEPATAGTFHGPNVIAGYSGNSVAAGQSAQTIAGGGNAALWCGRSETDPCTNKVTNSNGTVGGGVGNTAGGGATVGGGYGNTASDHEATVGGGWNNIADGGHATVGGGAHNTAIIGPATVGGGIKNIASGEGATVAGGEGNTVSNQRGFVGAGYGNKASNYETTVGGGRQNTASGEWATVGGGKANTASGDYAIVSGGITNTAGGGVAATVGGGENNQASGVRATVAGGKGNIAYFEATVGGGSGNWAQGYRSTIGGGGFNHASDYATVGGGQSNSTYSDFATLGGGNYNNVSGLAATVSGGISNTTSSGYATVGGGNTNTASGLSATVGGGISNNAGGNAAPLGEAATVGGGRNNKASGLSAATVGGGEDNLACRTDDFFPGDYATVGGGKANTAGGGEAATVGGGRNNKASGHYATVSAGLLNTASGNYSFVAGNRAKALHRGSFVWADARDEDFSSTISNSFNVRAAGGAVIDADNTYYGLLVSNTRGSAIYGNVNVPTPGAAVVAANSGTGRGIVASSAGTYSGYFYNKIWVEGGCEGCTLAYVAVNSGSGALEVGDVVAADGVRPSLASGGQPVLAVRQAAAAGAVGVVAGRAVLVESSKDGKTSVSAEAADGAIAAGDYLFIVVSGLAQARVDASAAPITAGQRLTAAAAPGSARAVRTVSVEGVSVAEAAPVIGVALESLPAGEGLIWVLVAVR